MKTSNLRIGRTYYLHVKGNPREVTWGTLIDITDNGKAIMNRNGKIFSCSPNKLHKKPEQAVVGKKAQQRARITINQQTQRIEEKLVDKAVQAKVKKLGHSTYATKYGDKYIVKNKPGFSGTFNTLEALDEWADSELKDLEILKNNILSQNYKLLRVENKNNEVLYFKIMSISFNKFEIRCKPSRQDIDIDELMKVNVLNRKDVPYMKVICK